MTRKMRGVRHKKSSGRARPSPIPYLPMDVWTGILIRTPAEDLLKFRRVCKSWYELIRSRSFAESHVDHWTSRTIGGFVFNLNWKIVRWCWTTDMAYLLYAMHHRGNITRSRGLLQENHDHGDNGCNCRYRKLLTSRQRAELGCGSKELQVLASCDGLILMCYAMGWRGRDVIYQLLICNPLTGSYKKLPGRVLGSFDFTIDYGWTMLRIASGQYKIFGMPMLGDSARWECYIFELQIGTEEQPEPRRKDLVVPLSQEWSINASTTKDGKVHWLANRPPGWDGKYYNIKVLSLDILREEFSTSVSVESRLCEPECCIFPSKGAFYHTVHRQDKSCSLWVLENFDTMTWTEYGNFRLIHDPDFLYLSGEIGDDKLFLGSYGVIYVFDLISKEFGRLSIDSRGSLGRINVIHTNSLIGCT